MKKIVALLLVMVLLLPLISSPAIAANNGIKGNNSKSEKAMEKSKESKESKDKRDKDNKGNSKEKNKLVDKIDSSKKKEIKDKLQDKEITKEEFKDSKDHWAKKSIEASKSLGWVKGYPDGTFKPQESVSSYEIIAIAMNLAEYLESVDEDIEETDDQIKDLTDDVPEWAEEAVDKAIKNKVINVNRFHSHVQATRAQAAVTLAKALKLEPVDTKEDNFTDSDLISSEDIGYILALLEAGIITGTPEGKFNPNSSITRGEIATMLANIAKEVAEEAE